MDNTSFHQPKKLKNLWRRHGIRLLFLPAYSPDYNPIEKSWANMKRAFKIKHYIYINRNKNGTRQVCICFAAKVARSSVRLGHSAMLYSHASIPHIFAVMDFAMQNP
ncbi:MAG: transposase [Spirochaetaceae bacterium]|jgi:transposase|nr:transposase [Spirochaetaceae bacterium]